MPNGPEHKRHWKANIINAAFASIGWAIIDPMIGAGVAVGYWLGNILEPDLDLVGRTRSERVAIEKGGWFGCAWFSYWTFYG